MESYAATNIEQQIKDAGLARKTGGMCKFFSIVIFTNSRYVLIRIFFFIVTKVHMLFEMVRPSSMTWAAD
jgi:hypothetical protein